MALDYDDRTDFDNAERGFVATLDPVRITNAEGRVIFDLSPYAYLDAKCPDTVHPSLWRQAQLCLTNGLFEVTEGIYQVRGFDLSNMSIIEGDTGVIVIDPLVSAECAAAALALYREHRGDKPVTGVIYTHSHADHFGGVLGVLPNGAGDVPILAPEGFMEHAVSENVYAGPAMTRRANYMYGDLLDPSPTGQVSTGLGIRVSQGSVGPAAAHGRHHPHRSGRDDRRSADRLPDHAGHRGAGRDELPASPTAARSAWPRTPPTTCTTC